MNLQQTGRSLEYLLHAYARTPWRAQRLWLGAALLLVIGLGMTAALYLDVTSQAGIAGRQIQDLRSSIIATELVNADLKSHLAESTSTVSMEARARLLGYEPVEQASLQYLSVPGFFEPEPVVLATAGSLRPSAASMPPEYTESLFDWIGRRLESAMDAGTGVP